MPRFVDSNLIKLVASLLIQADNPGITMVITCITSLTEIEMMVHNKVVKVYHFKVGPFQIKYKCEQKLRYKPSHCIVKFKDLM